MNVSGTIDSIMNQKPREVWSVSPDATVYDAIAMMAEKNVGALLVVENGKLAGILSERDYTRKVMLRGKRSRETQVREIMSTQLTTVDPKEGVDDCLRFMTEKRVRHLPVRQGWRHLRRDLDRRSREARHLGAKRDARSPRALYLWRLLELM